MTDTDDTRRDDIRAEIELWGNELKDELAIRIDQKLDELGARIGADE